MNVTQQDKNAWTFDTAVYYLLAIFPIAFSLVFFLRDRPVEYVPPYLWYLQLLSVVALSSTLLSLVGIVGYGSPNRENADALKRFKERGWPTDTLLTVSFVSYGKNKETIKRSVITASELLRRYKITHRIEVLLEIDLKEYLKDIPNLDVIVVPPTYQPENGVLHKARAMQYGVLQRRKLLEAIPQQWVFHCDEESILTEEALAGVADFVVKPENQERIGQGEIQYNSTAYAQNIFIAALDSARTGDDLGRFRFQFKFLEDSLIGVHGSFLLVPAKIEDRVGFDHGREASLTEDSYFAFFAAMEGVKFGWVAGYIREQSPFTIRDLCKQRRRWLNGIALLCLDSRVDFKRRALMFFCLAAWRLSWFCAFLSLPRAFHLIPCSEQLRIFSAGFTGCAIGMYLVGAYRNIQHLTIPLKEKIILFTKIAILVPFAAFVESLIVVYAVFRPSTQFYVVKKDASAALEG